MIGNLTPCWLCLPSAPPYQEGYGKINGTLNGSTSSDHNCWGTQSKILLIDLFLTGGNGTCIYNESSTPPKCCNLSASISINSSHHNQINWHVTAPDGHWWACNYGLTPCAYATVFQEHSQGICVLVQDFPRVYWHPETESITIISHEHDIAKRSLFFQ